MEELTEDEFDLLDELYFVQSFQVLLEELSWSKEKLIDNLQALHKKEYIKILSDHDTEVNKAIESITHGEIENLYFLASKKGLLIHNGF